MRRLFLFALCLLLCAAPVPADEARAVRQELSTRIDAVVALLRDQKLDKEQRNQRIIAIITPLFDFATMAQLSLGNKYWPDLSEQQRQTFSDLFTERLQDSYLEKLDLYTDEEVVYEDGQQSGSKIQLATSMISKDTRIAMLYKFYRAKGGWKIYDVEIGGVSVIQTYRSQFDGVLKEGTIDELLEKLRLDGEFTVPAGQDFPIR